MKRPPGHDRPDDIAPHDTWPDHEQVHYDDDDGFSYLDEPPIPPTPKQPRFRRMMSRRSLIGLGVASMAGAAAVAVPILTEGAFYPGTAVNGVDISQMSFDDARATLQNHFAAFENTAVDFEFGEQSWNASLARWAEGQQHTLGAYDRPWR